MQEVKGFDCPDMDDSSMSQPILSKHSFQVLTTAQSFDP